MDDAAYKQLFSRPRMVRDLLQGFAARDWSGALDLAALEPLSASFVSRDLQQRHGDSVWRVRFRDRGWLYLVLLLEFQSTVDRAMAVRLLTYTGLLFEQLIGGEKVLQEYGALPPVLPIVIYNGRRPWSAPLDVGELIARVDAPLARYQPSLRYFLLDEGQAGRGELPPGNLVSALAALEANRDRRSPALLRSLIGLLRAHGDEELTAAFRAWAKRLVPRRHHGAAPDWLPELEEVYAMWSEPTHAWTEDWLEQGRKEGLERGREEGREEERALLCRLAARKFDAATGRRLDDLLADVTEPDRLAQVGEWIIECERAADLFARIGDEGRSGG